jgi:hypothetical protein
MDPWTSARNSDGEEKPTLTFEDNFEPTDRLPDSVTYLCALGNIFHNASYVIFVIAIKQKVICWRFHVISC